MKKIQFLAAVFMSLIVGINCEKEGPPGPAGPQGPAGPAGPGGSTGPQGPAGTANVIYSRWTNGSTWAIDAGSGLNYFDINASLLTQSVLSGGDIHVYWAVLGDTVNHVRQLPYTETIGANIYFHNPKYSVGKIRIETNNLTMATSNRYRYILIPGAVLTGRYANINFANYQEAIQSLGIPY